VILALVLFIGSILSGLAILTDVVFAVKVFGVVLYEVILFGGVIFNVILLILSMLLFSWAMAIVNDAFNITTNTLIKHIDRLLMQILSQAKRPSGNINLSPYSHGKKSSVEPGIKSLGWGIEVSSYASDFIR